MHGESDNSILLYLGYHVVTCLLSLLELLSVANVFLRRV